MDEMYQYVLQERGRVVKELSSPKNIHSPTNNCERPSEILII